MKLPPPLREKRAVILDCDGVLWRAEVAIPGASAVVEELRASGKRVIFLTNNSTQTRRDYVKKMRKIGIKAEEEEIITSAFAASIYIREKFGPSARAYVIGERGLIRELKSAGVRIASPRDCKTGRVDVVVVGLDRKFNYKKLMHAMEALRRGAAFVATNTDPTLPTPRGEIPGAGAMVRALSTCAGREPDIVIGKPNPEIVRFALRMHNVEPHEAVIVGDRLETDIAAAKSCGCASVLVLTGVTRREDVERSEIKPDFVIESIRDLPKLLL